MASEGHFNSSISDEHINWSKVSLTIDENELPLLAPKLDWEIIATHRSLSEKALRENIKHLTKSKELISLISRYQSLSENFIHDHADILDWQNITVYQKLSEQFMETYLDHLDTKQLCEFQKVSDKFISEHYSRFQLPDVLPYIEFDSTLLSNLIEKHPKDFDDRAIWRLILQTQKLSHDFINKYAKHPKFSFCEVMKYQDVNSDFIDLYFHKIIVSMLTEICLRFSSI